MNSASFCSISKQFTHKFSANTSAHIQTLLEEVLPESYVPLEEE